IMTVEILKMLQIINLAESGSFSNPYLAYRQSFYLNWIALAFVGERPRPPAKSDPGCEGSSAKPQSCVGFPFVAGGDGESRHHAPSCFGSDADCFDSNHWYIETHVLVWFGDFDNDGTFPCQPAAALYGLVCSFQSFNRKDGSILDHDRLPNVEPGNFLADFPAEVDIVLFLP